LESVLSAAPRERMHLVIGGHVDHGKSTVIGRLLADMGALPEGKLAEIRERCARTARPFEYAFLLDALKDEQSQGITIDAARVFFKTSARDYIVLDAPGHIEFLRNMVTGAARAEAALLVIDANEGIQENSRRHGYMMSMLGIGQLTVLVNKMDLVGYCQHAFDRICAEYGDFLTQIGVTATGFVPVSAREGENLVRRGSTMPWFHGPTVLEALETFEAARPPVEKPFRMPVQDVYKFTADGDDRRIVAGTIESGSIGVGAEVVFYPSGKHSRIKTIEAFSAVPPDPALASQAIGFTLTDQIYITRGELAAIANEPRPHVTTRLRASIFWLGREPLVMGREYVLKLGTARVAARLEAVHRVIDASTLAAFESKDQVDRHDVAECTLQLARAIAFDDASGTLTTSRFVIIDDFEIRGGGIVREALADAQAGVRDKLLLRNYKWEMSFVPSEARAVRYGQRPFLMLLTGPKTTDRKELAKALELRLFEEGRVAYFLGMGNILYGVDADLDRRRNRTEHMRRLAEVANIMLDAGVILIVSAAELTESDLELIRASVGPERVATIWSGDAASADLLPDLVLDEQAPLLDRVERARALLQQSGAIGAGRSVM